MLITPIKPKAVSFRFPASNTTHQRSATAPPGILRKKDKSPPSPSPSTVQQAARSPQPDLIADILEQPKSVHPNKTKALTKSDNATMATIKSPTQEQPTLQASTELKSPEVITMKEVVPGSGEKVDQKTVKTRPDKWTTTGQARVFKAKSIKGHRPLTGSVRHGGKTIQTSHVTRMAYEVREQTNVSCLEHVRWMKHDVAKLREHLVKIEDEIKLANKAKIVLDAKVFDLRKCLSVNQQSVSSQQKKSHRQDGVLKKLREETHVLARSKRRLEQSIVQMKTHIWTLDNMRKTMKSKIAILSRALELDAQNFKMYQGPVATRPEYVSKQRHYAHHCPLPNNTTGDEAVAQLCSKSVEVMTASKILRGEMKSMIQSIYINKAEAHDKIASVVAKTMEETKAHQSDLMLQKGKVRMQSNSLGHQRHTEEIALGLALGPHSENYKSVSEKADRPLSRMRPCSAVVERTAYKNMADKITRQLSASAIQASRMASSDTSLGKKIRADSRSNSIDLQMLHKRTASLHKKVNANNL